VDKAIHGLCPLERTPPLHRPQETPRVFWGDGLPGPSRVNDIHPATAADLEADRRFPPDGVRVAVFDVVGTLVEPWPPVAVAYAAAGARHGFAIDSADVSRRFRAAWRRQELLDAEATPAFTTSPAREADRWRAIVADVFDAGESTDAIFAELWEHFGRAEAWRPLARGHSLVHAALERGLDVALASNFDERLHAIAPVLHPLRLAHHVFPSSAIGWRKPAPEFFRWVEDRLGCRADELVLVGDDPELDMAAAARAGWHTHAVG
jgi:putative hydrolase of the HAD superfamily